MSKKKLVIALYDYDESFSTPWMETGEYRLLSIDVRHKKGVHTDGDVTRIGAHPRCKLALDFIRIAIQKDVIEIVGATPTSADLSHDDHWLREDFACDCLDIGRMSKAPWFVEVKRSSAYRFYGTHEDHIYNNTRDPENDMALWTGGGFVIPKQRQKSNFYNAVFNANNTLTLSVADNITTAAANITRCGEVQ